MGNDFYVYVYFDQRIYGKWYYSGLTFNFQPFYVGKGRLNRDSSHLYPSILNQKSYKSSMIKSIFNDIGEYPLHYRIYSNLNEITAIKIEEDFIKYFGRKDNNTGILCNLTNGGVGLVNPSSKIRKMIGNKSKILYQYSIDGKFLKKWKSGSEFEKTTNNKASNICTAIKRNGTCYGYIWSYKFLGKKINTKKKYQMPIKFNKIKQICIKTNKIINIFESSLDAAMALNLSTSARNRILDCVNERSKTAYGFKWII